MYRTQKLTK